MPGIDLKPFAVLLVAVFGAFGRDYRAETYNVQLQLEASGELNVTEAVTFRFAGGPFQWVRREIKTTRTDGIDEVRARMDGKPCPEGTEPGAVEISGSSPVRVTWHFVPLSNEVHTFELRYRARGVLRVDGDGRRLVWAALPPDRRYRIDNTEIVLNYPHGNAPAKVSVAGADVEPGPASSSAHLNRVASGRRADLSALFGAGVFATAMPRWQAMEDERRREFAAGIRSAALLALVAVVAATFGFQGLWIPRPELPAAASRTSPSDSLAPALAAKLAGRHSGLSGTLLDLAGRGVLRIDEDTRGSSNSRKYSIRLVDPRGRLAPHEREFLSILFRDEQSPVRMDDFRARVMRKSGRLNRMVTAELDAAGLIDAERVRVRRKFLTAGALGCGLGFAFLLVAGIAWKGSHPELAGAAVVIGGTALIIGIGSLVIGGSASPWTGAGEIAAARSKDYAHHISEVVRGRAHFPDHAEFERMLPFAAAFGLAESLLKRYRKHGDGALPAWFGALDGNGGCDAFVALMAYSDSSAASAGADGGASGGGSSSAG